jgi:hypothetical protein
VLRQLPFKVLSQAKNSSVTFDQSPKVFNFCDKDPPGKDPVTNCVKTPFGLRLEGFPLGEVVNNDVAKALFPNQVC